MSEVPAVPHLSLPFIHPGAHLIFRARRLSIPA